MKYETTIKPVSEGISLAANLIKNGQVVAFPTETVYGLGADATNEDAVSQIFKIKGRPQDNPLIVHICDIGDVNLLCEDISDMALRLMRAFFPGAFTAVLKASPLIPKSVRANLDTVAIRIPANAHTLQIIKESGTFVAAPSANISGRPSPTNAQDVFTDLGGKIPLILDGGECEFGVESTVCDLTKDAPVILRPGAVTREMIAKICPHVRIAKGVLKHTSGVVLSPGMKYTHYSPNADVFVVKADAESVLAKKINMLYDSFTNQGKKPIIFCTEGEPYAKKNVRVLGKDAEQVAKSVFSALRRADENGFDTVLFEDLDEKGMGLAVMNRILRSAGFKVL